MRRRGFAGEGFIAERGLVQERSHDDGGLLEVVALDAVAEVLVGVVGAGAVLDRVLDELEGGNTDGVERLVVDAEGARGRERAAPWAWKGWSQRRKIGWTASLFSS